MAKDEKPQVDQAPRGEVKTAEHWAEKHGHLAERTRHRRVLHGTGVGTVEKTNLARRHYEGAKALHGWPEGKELTEDEYLAAVKAASEHVYR